MKITVDFVELSSVLGYSNAVLSDKSVDDKIKNVIFMVTPEETLVVGYNAFTFCRTRLETAVADGVIGDWQFQIKASELNKIVSAFSNLYKTKVEKLDFEDSGVRIKITVHELAVKEEDSRLSQDSTFEMENAPVLSGIDKEIHTEFPEDIDIVTSGDLLLYLDSLIPLMTNDSANSISSRMNFAEDYVFTTSPHWSAFIKNRLSDEFKNLCLGYTSATFLKKLCEGIENLNVARLDNYLCIEAGSTQAFMRYKPVKVKYAPFVNKKSNEHGIRLDRLYFKDVLKRMGIVSADGKMSIVDGETLLVENETFQQSVPLLAVKGNAVGIKFNVSIPAMVQLILGKDDVFAEDIFIYFVPTTRGHMLYLSDKTGAWFTNAQVVNA